MSKYIKTGPNLNLNCLPKAFVFLKAYIGRQKIIDIIQNFRGDLYQTWEKGLDVFEELLLDADWALNAGNWMWLSASAFFHQYYRYKRLNLFWRKIFFIYLPLPTYNLMANASINPGALRAVGLLLFFCYGAWTKFSLLIWRL